LFIKFPSEHPCRNIPEEVRDFFAGGAKGVAHGIYYDDRVYDVIEGKHSDLYMPSLGKISSKTLKWETDIKFEPYLRYENEKYALFSVSSGYRFACFTYLKIVIRKTDGEIVNSIQSGLNILEEAIFDDVYYFKLVDDSRIHCMKIGE